MNRITRLGFALILAAATLIPVESGAATCDTSRCFNISCSQHVCPEGKVPFPQCAVQVCQPYCTCVSLPS